MDNIVRFLGIPTNPLIEVNPLDTNVIFKLGQLVLVILAILLLISGTIGFVARIAGITRLDIEMGKWSSRIALALVYTILVWLGISMLTSYIGDHILDVINGAVILVGVITSIIQRFTKDQRSANRTLVFIFGLVVFMLIWNFVYSAVMDAMPKDFVEEVGSEFHASFFNDVFRYWGWM